MSHILVIIISKTKALRDASTDPKQQSLLDDLGAGAEALDAKITHGDPHSAEIEAVLENLQAWLETASITATNFDAELNAQIAAVQQYL